MSDPPFRRFVALGDSTTEGLEDPYPGGAGYRGWADRLAERMAAHTPELLYANLAIRGRKLGQIHAEQTEPAVAMAPDLVSVVGGVNDLLRPRSDVLAVGDHLEAMVLRLSGAGATVMLMTYPDFSELMGLASGSAARIRLLNLRIRGLADRTGGPLIDLERGGPMDPRLFHPDRLHANAAGHERIALAAAEALGLPGADDAWRAPLPPAPAMARHAVLREDLRWARAHLLPWIGRRLRGTSSGDGVLPKRPALAPVTPPGEV